MRILYFTRGWTAHDRRLVKAAAAGGHEVVLLRKENGGAPLPAGTLPAGVREECAGGDVCAAVRRIQPDVLHAGPVPTCGYVAALSGFHPLVLMSWGSDLLLEAGSDIQLRRQARMALDASDLFLCDCREVADTAAALAGGVAGRTTVFPWGIDLPRFAPADRTSELRSRLGWQDAIVVISTRSWEPIYRIDMVIEAFAAARQRVPALRLILAGSGSLKVDVPEDVFQPGRVLEEGLPEYYRAADIYLSCAACDGTSISLLEAMASSLPVVVTGRPSNREWVCPEKNGWLCRDVAGFASSLAEAAELEPEERAAIGSANRAVVEARADWRVHSRTLLEVYEQASQLYAHSA
jgi:glycosyltransferase involved in cell wall biosynthesis